MVPAVFLLASTALAGPGGWRDLLKGPGPLPAEGAPGAPPPAMQADWDVQHYDIALALNPDARALRGTVGALVAARVDGPGALVLHAGEPTLLGVEVDGGAVTVTRDGDEVRVPMPDGLARGDEVLVTVRYQASGTTDPSVPGLHWGSPIYTFSEPEGARDWLVVYDAPADKAILSWHVTAPSDLVVLANGEPAGTEAVEDGITWHFEFPWPIATYLMVVNAGAFAEDRDDSGPVPVSTWAAADDLDRAARALADTPEMVAFLSDLFGPYPYSLYGNVLVPFGGAMEHTTLTSFGQDLIWHDQYAELVDVHELGHQWWGDWVTCAEWEEIWLNEGFASYTEALWVERQEGEQALQDYVWGQRESYLEWHEWEGVFALWDPEYMWGGTVYDKGSVVLHMLRFVLGDEAFFEGLARYGDAHAHDVATTEDLRAAMEAVHGADLSWFFDEWVYRAGDPSFRVGLTNTALADGTWQVDVHVEQTGADTWAMPVEWTLVLADGSRLDDQQWVQGERSTFSSCLPEPAADLDWSPYGHLLYEDLVLDLDGFAPAPLVCGEAVTDTDEPADSGVDSGDDSGEGPDPPPRSCGCAPPVAPAALLPWLIGGSLWCGRRRRR